MGHGRGRENFWTDKSVLDQALFVARIRDAGTGVTGVGAALWLFNYPHDLKKVRQGWLAQLDKRRAWEQAKGRKNVRKLVRPIARRLARNFHIKRDLAEAFCVVAFRFISVTKPKVALEHVQELLQVVFEIMGMSARECSGGRSASKIGSRDRDIPFTEHDEVFFLSMLKAFDLNSVHAMARATNEELEEARRQLNNIRSIATRAFSVLAEEIDGLTLGELAMVRFGSFCLAGLTSLIAAGKGWKLNITLSKLSDFVESFRIPKTVDEWLVSTEHNARLKKSLKVLLEDLADLWKTSGFPFVAGTQTQF
jgi:hypothetical protein